jgi:soluble lytic murein transglycosylase-like protein
MEAKFPLIFIIVIVLALAVYYFTNQNQASSMTDSSSNVPSVPSVPAIVPATIPAGSLQDQIRAKFFDIANNIVNQYGLNIDPNMILATIEQESGSRSISENSGTVIGDGGKSIGYCQVEAGAISDVNNYFNTNFASSDMSDTVKNVTAGLLYLYLGYSVKPSLTNPVWLAYVRYNGGLGQSETNNNAMDVKYANEALAKYLVYAG